MNDTPFCPICRDDCHPRCVFKSSVTGCQWLLSLQHIDCISADIGQINDTLETLLSEQETVEDGKRESA